MRNKNNFLSENDVYFSLEGYDEATVKKIVEKAIQEQNK